MRSEMLLGNFMWGVFYPNLIAFYCTVYEANLRCDTNACNIDLHTFLTWTRLCRVLSSTVNQLRRAQTISSLHFPELHFFCFIFQKFKHKRNEAQRNEIKSATQHSPTNLEIESIPTAFSAFMLRECVFGGKFLWWIKVLLAPKLQSATQIDNSYFKFHFIFK